MTHLTGTAIIVGVLSLAVVMFLKFEIPDAPLRPADTEVVVGACAVAVAALRWIVRRATRKGGSA